MAFSNLQGLGPEKFDQIVNLLLRGEPALKLARQMLAPPPDGWGVFEGMAENTLEQQLKRMRHAISKGFFNPRRAKALAEGGANRTLPILQQISVRVLDRLEELAEVQRDRVFELREKEKANLLPQVSAKMAPQEYRHLLTQTNAVLSDYRQTLLDLQEVRFKLGMDELHTPSTQVNLKGATSMTTYPDGMSVQKQIFEAVSTVERVLNARRIRPHIPEPSYQDRTYRVDPPAESDD